jgi:hypothetical protein
MPGSVRFRYNFERYGTAGLTRQSLALGKQVPGYTSADRPHAQQADIYRAFFLHYPTYSFL